MNKRNHRRILEECIKFLSLNNVAVTESVKTVIEYFFSVDHHISLAHIERFAEENGFPLSKSDIKKAFDLLVDYGFASRRVFADGMERYEHMHIGEHHDHLYCLKCGKIIEFFSSQLEDQQLEAAGHHNFHAFSHKMQINGLCSDCYGAASQTLMPLAMVPEGGKFRIVEFATGHGHFSGHGLAKRFNDLGLVPGTVGEIIHNTRGMIIILLGETRVALRRGQSQRIRVTILN